MSSLTRERAWKARFFQEVAPRPGERILDHRCGTGVLTLMLYHACPDAEIMGLDVDRKALLAARMRARTSKARVTFWRGELNDCRAESFDKVASSMLPLHLGTEARRKVIRQAATLLRPGGSLHVADWEKPDALKLLLIGRVTMQEVGGEPPCSIAELMQESGLSKTVKSYGHSTILGSIGFYRGVRQ